MPKPEWRGGISGNLPATDDGVDGTADIAADQLAAAEGQIIDAIGAEVSAASMVQRP